MQASQRNPTLKQHHKAILAAVAVAATGYLAPPLHLLFLPLVYLNTLIHETCHAIVAFATGGQAVYINVFRDGSGVTPILGGNGPMEASAGYLGATLVGGLMLWIGRTPARAKGVLGVLGIALAVSMILWVRGDLVGISAGIFWTVALTVAAIRLEGAQALFLCQLIAVSQCFNAITSVYDLFQISISTDRHSDAMLMQQFTYIPATVWASMWLAFSLAIVTWMLRKAWGEAPA